MGGSRLLLLLISVLFVQFSLSYIVRHSVVQIVNYFDQLFLPSSYCRRDELGCSSFIYSNSVPITSRQAKFSYTFGKEEAIEGEYGEREKEKNLPNQNKDRRKCANFN